MPRPKAIPDEQVLGIARELFLSKGIAASTLEIARRAGVSEALLFKRFHTKEQLFSLAMTATEEPAWIARAGQLQGRGELRDNLVELASLMLESLQRFVPRMLTVWSARLPSPGSGPVPPPVRDLEALASFLQAEVRLGRMRPCDTHGLARTLMGALFNHVVLDAMGVGQHLPLAAPTYVRELVDTLWTGIAPVPDARAQRSRERPLTHSSSTPRRRPRPS